MQLGPPFAWATGAIVVVAAVSGVRRRLGPPPLKVTDMPSFRWMLHAADGSELRASEEFDSKEAAEAWMGSEWSSLLDEGAETVSLMQDTERLYRMGLREA
jgi:hypothetical protein